MSVSLTEFGRRRTRGAAVLAQLARSLESTGMGAVVERLTSLSERAAAGRFVVLLLGCFSTGKSTLVNALLSRPALPAKVNPCTAILTEVVHGESPSVTVFFDNRGRGAEPPVEPRVMTVDDFLREYQLQTGEDLAGDERTDRFGHIERAVLAYPLPLLANGVALLDTPGLDDDPARTARTLDTLPDADAVLFVLNATRFLTELERTTLERHLLPLGLTNLFFVTTMADLLSALSDDPEGQREEIEKRARYLVPLCPEGRFHERFFLVDARGALRARWDRETKARREPVDALALKHSGLDRFETSLENFLVHERGRAQLEHLVSVARHAQQEVERQAGLDRATASATAAELAARQEQLGPSFDRLTRIVDRVERRAERFVARQQDLVFQDLRDFIARAEMDLPEAVAQFDLGPTAGLDLLTGPGRVRVEARLREELRRWLDQRTSTWQADLAPRLERSLAELRVELSGDATDFDALCREIVDGFTATRVPLPDDATASASTMGAAERWTSLALGALLLSPGTMAAGWTEGYGGVLRGAATRLGVRVAILTLGALLGPVGWLGIALYVVSDAVLIGLTGGHQLQRLRQQVADGLHGKLTAQVDAERDALRERVASAFLPLTNALCAAARAEVSDLKTALDRIVAARRLAAADAAARDASWSAARTALSRALEELEELARLP